MNVNQNLTTGIEYVTPAMANRLLSANNARNRPIRQSKVDHFVALMMFGGWEVSAANIVITANGDIADGQHKLKAIVTFGKPMQCIVTRGASQKAIVQHDALERTVDDQLSILGVSASERPRTGAYLRRIYNYSVYCSTYSKETLTRNLPSGLVELIYRSEKDFIDKYLDTVNRELEQTTLAKYAGHVVVAARIAIKNGYTPAVVDTVINDGSLYPLAKQGLQPQSGATVLPFIQEMLEQCKQKGTATWSIA